MKIFCTPDENAQVVTEADLKVVLFERCKSPTNGYAGNTIWDEIKKKKLAPEPKAWDLLSIALSVMAADYAGHRGKSHDGWTRVFDLTIAVNDKNFWNSQSALLSKQLGFLTSDRWSITFVDGGYLPEYKKGEKIQYPKNDSIALLSGGLDSFIGIIDLIEKGVKPYAVSQMVNDDSKKQKDIVNLFSPAVPLIQLNHNVNVPDSESPPSQRARSIIFLAYGVLITSCLEKHKQGQPVTLYMCENGYISLNPPLTNIRIGSLSTRTTHPIFLKFFQQLLDNSGLQITIKNPYQDKTKGEMLKNCLNQNILKSYASQTTSCGRYRVTKHQHCGRCVPCLVRRAAFKKWGVKDDTTYKYDDLSIKSDDYSNYDDVKSVAMAIIEIKEKGLDLWIGSSLNTTLLGDTSRYKNTIEKGLNELEEFLKVYNL
jgi:hypothetical protein